MGGREGWEDGRMGRRCEGRMGGDSGDGTSEGHVIVIL